MHRFGTLAIILTACVAAPLAGATTNELARNDDVWVRWSLAENVVSKSVLENSTFEVPPGKLFRPAMLARNDLNETIRDVTLVIIPHNVTMTFSLGPTYAGDEPQVVLAHWNTIPPQHESLGALWFVMDSSQKGPFSFDATLLFERADGTREFSVTSLHLIPTKQSLTVALVDSPVGIGSLATAGALGVSVGVVFGRWTKRKHGGRTQ